MHYWKISSRLSASSLYSCFLNSCWKRNAFVFFHHSVSPIISLSKEIILFERLWLLSCFGWWRLKWTFSVTLCMLISGPLCVFLLSSDVSHAVAVSSVLFAALGAAGVQRCSDCCSQQLLHANSSEFSGPKSSQLLSSQQPGLTRLDISSSGWLCSDSWLICSKQCLRLTQPNGGAFHWFRVGLEVTLSNSNQRQHLNGVRTPGHGVSVHPLCCFPLFWEQTVST